jgi:hypothetical protein
VTGGAQQAAEATNPQYLAASAMLKRALIQWHGPHPIEARDSSPAAPKGGSDVPSCAWPDARALEEKALDRSLPGESG